MNNGMAWQNLMIQQINFENQQRQMLQHIIQQNILLQQQQQQEDDEKDEPCPEEQRTLFIASLDESKVDEEILYELFIQAGPIEKVSFPKKKSFAFITYIHSCSCIYAMHLYQDVKLFGKPVVIKFNGKTNLPPLLRRLLPPDYGMARDCTLAQPHNPFADPPKPERRSFDNSSLRNSRFAAFMDNGNDRNDRNYRRDDSPHGYSRDRSNDNHRRRERSPTRRRQDKDSEKNWTHGPDRNRSRSHHGSQPYDKRRF